MDCHLQPVHGSRVSQKVLNQRLTQKHPAESIILLTQLRKYLNEVLLDQIPALSYMLRSLEELSLMQVPTHLTVSPFVVQQVPVISAAITKDQDWKELAR